MLAVFVLSLVISASLLGMFAHNVLSGVGFIPGLEGGAMAACAAASLYTAVQMLWMATIRLLVPTPECSYSIRHRFQSIPTKEKND